MTDFTAFGLVMDSARSSASAPRPSTLKKETLKRIKSFISGVFSRAKQLGFYDGANPVVNSEVAKSALSTGEREVYLFADVKAILAQLGEPARTLVATAAFSGLRRGELAAMRWEHWKGGSYAVNGSVWAGKVTTPKTTASADVVPVIGYLRQVWKEHHARCGEPKTGWMFASARNTPIVPANVVNREIKPVLNRCAVCGKNKGECAGDEHKYQRDPKLPA